MPSGKIHSALTLSTLSGVVAPYALVQFNGNPWMYGAGCLVGILVMPDLDVDGGNITDSFIRKVFPPAQWLWRTIWTPYSKFIPHRSPLSHAPILGTVLRIGYLFLIVNIVNLLFHWIVDTVFSLYFVWDWSFFFGLCHVDTIHYLVDITIKGKESFEE